MRDCFEGALLVADEFSLPEIWLGLHRSAVEWARHAMVADGAALQHRLTLSDRNMLTLLADVPALRWRELCKAAGQTSTGAVAEMWCADADLISVADTWAMMSVDTKNPHEISLRLLPRERLPRIDQLSTAITWAQGRLGVLAFVIHANPDMKIDVSDAHLREAPQPIASLLGARGILRKLSC